MDTNATDKLASVLAERMKGKYDGTAEQRCKSAGFLAEDLLETQYDCDHIREEIARLKDGIYSRRRGYINMVHRYGVTTREIGEAMGLSHQRVAQILKEPDDW